MIIVIFIQILTFTYTPPILAQERAHTYHRLIKMFKFQNFFIEGYPENVDIWAFCFFDKILRMLLYQRF